MVTAQQAKKEYKKALKFLKRDKEYFLSEYYFVKPMLEEANLIAHGIHVWAKHQANQGLLNQLVNNLKKVERSQRWQQLRTRYPKLREVMGRLMQLPIFDNNTRGKVAKLMEQEHVFENEILKITADELHKAIVGKKLHEIKFKEEVVPKISKLKVDLQAITLILEQLKDAIEQKG